jgi:hypothetical protein
MKTEFKAKAKVFNGKDFSTHLNIVEKRENKFKDDTLVFYRGEKTIWLHESKVKLI